MKRVKVKSGTEVLLSTLNNVMLEQRGYHEENKDSEEKLAVRHCLEGDLVVPEVLVMNHDQIMALYKKKDLNPDVTKMLEYFTDIKQIKENIIRVGFRLNKEDNKGVYILIIKNSDIETVASEDKITDDEQKVMDLFGLKE